MPEHNPRRQPEKEEEDLDYEVHGRIQEQRSRGLDDSERERARDSDFIKRITREAVKETLLEMGIDVSSPSEVKEVQRDMAWIRDTRNGAQRVSANIKRAGIFAIIAALLAALWTGIKTKIGT